MGLFDWVGRWFKPKVRETTLRDIAERQPLPPEKTIDDLSGHLRHNRALTKQELFRRLGVEDLQFAYFNPFTLEAIVPKAHEVPLRYWWHRVPKRNGGTRLLHSPNPILKSIQRKLLRKVFARLAIHPAAKGFRRGESVATHARLHIGQAVVVRIDIKDFFPRTSFRRVWTYFRLVGWDNEATLLLARLCCRSSSRYWGHPQGAPTSPLLSNAVNYRLDARLTGLAKRSKAIYSRYADDLIFSFAEDNRRFIRGVVRRVRRILWEHGYRINQSKLRMMRRHQPQLITGLVVNEKVQLPRKVRRWLRAVEHHVRTGRPITLTAEQLRGWRAYQAMIQKQASS